MEADTLAQEATDQSTFEDDMKACAIEKAGREKSAEMKGQEKKRLIAKISECISNIISESHELGLCSALDVQFLVKLLG